MRLTDLLALSHVPRWSIVARMKEQSVADHTFRMTIIAIELAERLKIPIGCSAIIYCLHHDGPESRTADIPSGAKKKIEAEGFFDWDLVDWHSESPYHPEQVQARVIWLSDKIEAATWIARWGLGEHADQVALRCTEEVENYLRIECPPEWFDTVHKLMLDILADSGRANWLNRS